MSSMNYSLHMNVVLHNVIFFKDDTGIRCPPEWGRVSFWAWFLRVSSSCPLTVTAGLLGIFKILQIFKKSWHYWTWSMKVLFKSKWSVKMLLNFFNTSWHYLLFGSRRNVLLLIPCLSGSSALDPPRITSRLSSSCSKGGGWKKWQRQQQEIVKVALKTKCYGERFNQVWRRVPRTDLSQTSYWTLVWLAFHAQDTYLNN